MPVEAVKTKSEISANLSGQRENEKEASLPAENEAKKIIEDKKENVIAAAPVENKDIVVEEKEKKLLPLVEENKTEQPKGEKLKIKIYLEQMHYKFKFFYLF